MTSCRGPLPASNSRVLIGPVWSHQAGSQRYEGLDCLFSLQVRYIWQFRKLADWSRSRRRKCNTERGSNTCSYCHERGFNCYRGVTQLKARRNENIGIPVQSPRIETSETGKPLPPTELCLELVELYFDLIHDQFHSLFHRPTFMEQVRNGTAPKVLLFAMMALSARFESTTSLASRCWYCSDSRQMKYSQISRREIDVCRTMTKAQDSSTFESIPLPPFKLACSLVVSALLKTMQLQNPCTTRWHVGWQLY